MLANWTMNVDYWNMYVGYLQDSDSSYCFILYFFFTKNMNPSVIILWSVFTPLISEICQSSSVVDLLPASVISIVATQVKFSQKLLWSVRYKILDWIIIFLQTPHFRGSTVMQINIVPKCILLLFMEHAGSEFFIRWKNAFVKLKIQAISTLVLDDKENHPNVRVFAVRNRI